MCAKLLFTPEIEIVKQLKTMKYDTYLWLFKSLKKATELAKSNFTNM